MQESYSVGPRPSTTILPSSSNSQVDRPLSSLTTAIATFIGLRARGFWPILIYPPGLTIETRDGPKVTTGKEPIRGGWGRFRWTIDKAKRIIEEFPAAGVGVCLGPGRGPGGTWIIDVECDGPEAAESLARLFGGEVIATLGWSSTRGGHYLLIVDADRMLSLLARMKTAEVKDKPGVYHLAALPGVELRIGGNKPDGVVKQIQSVVPPTPGTDGATRVWHDGHDDPAHAPEAFYAFLGTIADQAEAQAPAKSAATPRTGTDGTMPVIDPKATSDTPENWLKTQMMTAYGRVAMAPTGERHATVLSQSRWLAGFLRHDLGFTEGELETAMIRAADEAAPERKGDNPRCVRDAIADGKGSPLELPKRFQGNGSGGGSVGPVRASATGQAGLNGDGHHVGNGDADAARSRTIAEYRPKTFGVIIKAIGALQHLWEDWLVLGHLSLIYSKPKQGKTRVYLRWIKTLWFAEDWADGTPNPWPAGTKTLVLPYDRNHAEIHADLQALGVPDEAALCPHDPRDETGVSLLSLSDPLMLEILEHVVVQDPAIKLVVVDTLTYASERSLSKPEDMKVILDGIMGIAQRHQVAVLVLIHENREGEALGRRICERARVLMRLERYSEDDPTRLKLYVKESNFPRRPSLMVTHTDEGVRFDPESGRTDPEAARRDACAGWVGDYLWARGVGVEVDYGTLIRDAGAAGFAGTEDDKGRWSNPKLLDRAIKAINGRTIPGLEPVTIERRDQPEAGRTRPRIFYRIETTVSPVAPARTREGNPETMQHTIF